MAASYAFSVSGADHRLPVETQIRRLEISEMKCLDGEAFYIFRSAKLFGKRSPLPGAVYTAFRRTVALIVVAKQRGIIAEAKPVLEALLDQGIRLDSALVEAALQLAGE